MERKLIVAYLVRPAEGGIKTHLLTLLAGLDKTRFTPVLICPPGSSIYAEAERAGYKVIPLEMVGEIDPGKDLKTAMRLRQILKSLKPNVLHIHSAKAGLVGRLAVIGLAKRPKVVVTMHSFVFDERVSPKKRTLIGMMERFLSRYTERIIAVSDALRNELVNEMHLNPRLVTVVQNGIVIRDIAKPERKERRVVGTVSRLAPQKGLDDFLRAALLISNRFPTVRCPIVGDGPFKEDLERQVKMLGLVETVEFMGHQKDVFPILATFDVFVLPSTSEAFGLTIIEAMSLGIPVVATRAGGIPELVDGETTGLLADPGVPHDLAGKVCEILQDEDLAHKLSEGGRNLVRSRFSSERMVDETQKIYLRQ